MSSFLSPSAAFPEQGPVDWRISEIFWQASPPVFTDPGSGKINRVEVLRDTPCGSASCIAGKLTGADIMDMGSLTRFCYDEQHNDEADNYCLAEMDPRYPLMQEAGDLLKDALFEGCGLPSTKDTILSVLKRSGETGVEDLAVTGCRTAFRQGGPQDA